jgi:penicillin-binding protein 2
MIERSAERRAPLSPQLALRVAVLGGLALVLFGIILFRLWYLQVLSGDQYVQLATNNRVRDIAIQAPRGNIVDRNGAPLVDSRPATAVQIARDQLPTDAAQQQLMFRHLGHVLGIPAASIARTLGDKRNLPYANVTSTTDAGQAALVYLSERQQEFPGVVETPIYLRGYPYHDLAAQLVGNVGQITAPELKMPRFRGITQNTVVGQDGVEWSYDHYLRGRDGAKRVQVDALGRPRGGPLSEAQPIAGHELKLTIDLALQREGQVALRKGIALAQGNGHPARAGAFVALDPRDGEVLAMGSAPTFDPRVFTHPITQSTYTRLFGAANGAPQVNRAVAGLYPTGSTFKPITALATLQSGGLSPDRTIDDTGCITVGLAHQKFCNAGKTAHGALSLRDALKVSSDVFFYTLGEEANALQGAVIQSWARSLGLGHTTGVDLPGEAAGVIPDRQWREQINERELRCERRRHVRFCGISDGRPWTVGDNVNFAVGQGDLQATPLQMAVAYSTIANGGTVVRPHLGFEVDDQRGRLVQRIDPGASRHVDFNAGNAQAILDGLRLAASAPGGTSSDVFAGFGRPVYGKTGTAQRNGQDDQSWYVAYAPDKQRPIVIALTVEKGGFGAEAAAPAVRLMLAQWFHRPKKLVAGHSRTR